MCAVREGVHGLERTWKAQEELGRARKSQEEPGRARKSHYPLLRGVHYVEEKSESRSGSGKKEIFDQESFFNRRAKGELA
jgi:hypothetical protein